MSISLVAWPAVVGTGVVFVLAVVVVLRSARRGRRLLPVRAAVLASAATAALAVTLHASGLVPLDLPLWFYAVAVLPFLGPSVAVVAGRALRGPARTLAVACLPLGLVVSVLVVNQHYQYWPTLDALLGKDHTDPLLDAPTVLRMAGPEGLTETASVGGTGTPEPTRVGRLVDITIPGTASGFHARAARVWLPPGFVSDPGRPRPVIEM